MWTDAVTNNKHAEGGGGNSVYQGIILASMKEAMDSLAKQVSADNKQEQVYVASIFENEPEKETPQENVITDELDEQAIDIMLENAEQLGLDEELISLLQEFMNNRKELENLALIKQNKKLLEEIVSIKIALEVAMESLKQKLGLQEVMGKSELINAIRESLAQGNLPNITEAEINLGEVINQSLVQNKEAVANIASNILQSFAEKGHLPANEVLSQIKEMVAQQIEMLVKQLLPEIQVAIEEKQATQTPEQILQQPNSIVPETIKMSPTSMIEVAGKQAAVMDNIAMQTAANNNIANIQATIQPQITSPNLNALIAAQQNIIPQAPEASYNSMAGSVDQVAKAHEGGCTCGCGGGRESADYVAQEGSIDKTSEAQQKSGACDCGNCASHSQKNMLDTAMAGVPTNQLEQANQAIVSQQQSASIAVA